MGNKWFSAEKMSKGISLFGLCACVFLLLLASFAGAQVLQCSCTSCHGNPPTESTRGGPNGLVGIGLGLGTASGAHDHFTRLRQNLTCENCHFGAMPESPIPDLKLQMGFSINGKSGTGMSYDGMPSFIDPKWTYEATNGTTVTQNGTMKCSNVYCHGGGTGGTNNKGGISKSAYLNSINDPRIVAQSISPAWSNVSPIGCNYCHGVGTADGRPSYQSRIPKANSHVQPHVGFKCHVCHYATTQDDASIYDVTKHHNGVYDVVPDPTVTFTYTYDPGGGKCTNVSCHGGDPHVGYWGSAITGGTGITANVNVTFGPSCYQVTVTATPLSGSQQQLPPYVYDWDWGDGTTTSGTSDTAPINASHAYIQGGTYYSTFNYRDKNYISGSSALVPITLQSVNIPPVANSSTVSVKGMTAIFTDMSYDTDYNTCGHSGAGTIYLNWGDGVAINQQPLNLTDQPSNQAYTHTYARAGTYYLQHSVSDNAGGSAQDPTTPLLVTVPGTFTISGKITHAGGKMGYTPGQAFYNVSVQLYTKNGSYVDGVSTKSDGTYTISGIPETQHYDVIPNRSGFTFAPVSVDVYQSTTGVDFVGTP